MKMTMMISALFACLMFSTSSFAEGGGLEEIIKPAGEVESQTQNNRRKKVQMCNECGKPEPQCECEGEGHGVDHQ